MDRDNGSLADVSGGSGFKPSPTLQRVAAGQLCTGCGLCASLSEGAIGMASLPPGYSRPVQRAALSSDCERIIAATCPGVQVAAWPAAPIVHPSWGPIVSLETGFADDPDVRFKGSSGGAVTALALFALESGLVDRVVHVGADLEDPAANRVLVSRSPDEVIAGAGSRYVSSSPLIEIQQMLAEGGSMAFVGKPCDVSALRQLAKVDPRVDRHIPLMLAFFCAGIPSRNAVDRVLAVLDAPTQDLAAFRYRGNGWPGKAAAVRKDGSVSERRYEESWGGYLSHEVQFRCKICPDAVGGGADIACADAWYGGETGYPTFEEHDGRSLIASRTARGEQILRAAIAAGRLSSEPLALDQIDLMQPSQAARKSLVQARVAAVATLGRPWPRMVGLKVSAAAQTAPAALKLKNFLGTIRRALRGRLSRR